MDRAVSKIEGGAGLYIDISLLDLRLGLSDDRIVPSDSIIGIIIYDIVATQLRVFMSAPAPSACTHAFLHYYCN